VVEGGRRRKRSAGVREGPTVAPSGRLVVGLANYGWWLKQRIEREGEKNGRNPGAKG